MKRSLPGSEQLHACGQVIRAGTRSERPMTMEVWATVASVGTFVVIAATAIVAFVQLRHARAGNQIAADPRSNKIRRYGFGLSVSRHVSTSGMRATPAG